MTRRNGYVLDVTIIHRELGTRHLGRDRVHHTIDERDTVTGIGRGGVGAGGIELESVKSRTPGKCGVNTRNGVDS